MGNTLDNVSPSPPWEPSLPSPTFGWSRSAQGPVPYSPSRPAASAQLLTASDRAAFLFFHLGPPAFRGYLGRGCLRQRSSERQRKLSVDRGHILS